jgi:CheY-like chemotaxis protein/nitrogen-specific signal transduction histidine kinase
VSGFIAVASDITKLKEAKEAAEAASKAKTAFLANMSHEIRTPLGVVLGFCELLLLPDQSKLDRANAIDAIKRNGKLLSNIINDILDLSKIEAGKLSIEKSRVSLDDLLKDLNSLLYLEASEKGLKLSLTKEDSLPKTVITDPLRLRQILLNIVGNAIKFTERGFVKVRVRTEKRGSGKSLVFTVTDSGRGMSSEQATKLFEPFMQADSSTVRRYGGTGLGLVLSRKLANALGGDVILAESAVDKGSSFEISIDPGTPAKADEVGETIRSSAVAKDLANDFSLEKLNILLVEDSVDNQILVSRLLMMVGANVDTACNGKEGVSKALSNNYDLVLMDLRMPEMDGYQATKELRKNGFKRPVIALTANALKEDRMRCLAAGFDDHLGKPIDRNLLLEMVRQHSEHPHPLDS